MLLMRHVLYFYEKLAFRLEDVPQFSRAFFFRKGTSAFHKQHTDRFFLLLFTSVVCCILLYIAKLFVYKGLQVYDGGR